MIHSGRNKQHQSFLCNEIRRLPNKTVRKIALKNETLI